MQTLSSFSNPFLGELIVLQSLEESLKTFQCSCHRIKNDDELNKILSSPDSLKKYALYFFDEFTFIDPQHQPRVRFEQMKDRWFILDFFGHKKAHSELARQGDKWRYLTAFPSKYNTFIGFFLKPAASVQIEKKRQGLLWGKESRYFKDRRVADVVNIVAKDLKLISTIAPVHAPRALRNSGIEFVGHLNKEDWLKTLSESQFVLGVGDPILGPTAIEALAHGCQFWNPIYDPPRVINPGSDDIEARTQHDGVIEVAKREGKLEYICEYDLSKPSTIHKCVHDLPGKLPFYLPSDFQETSHQMRVAALLSKVAKDLNSSNDSPAKLKAQESKKSS